jgi:GT2 family glycosyltransferase
MKTDIVMLAMSQPEMTINAINEIMNTTFKENTTDNVCSLISGIRILLINNGGGEQIAKVKNYFGPMIQYHEFKENQGVAGGRNYGISWFLNGESDYLVNIDNDIKPVGNWLSCLINPFANDKSIGMTAPMTNYTCNEYQRLEIPVDDLSNWYEYYLEGVTEEYLECPENKYMIGFCNCVPREVVEKVGYHDLAYKLYGNEDADYYFTMKKLGYKGVFCKKSVVYHYGNKGLESLGTKGMIEWSASKRYFAKKWGFET